MLISIEFAQTCVAPRSSSRHSCMHHRVRVCVHIGMGHSILTSSSASATSLPGGAKLTVSILLPKHTLWLDIKIGGKCTFFMFFKKPLNQASRVVLINNFFSFSFL
jgi:hypothetical protein